MVNGGTGSNCICANGMQMSANVNGGTTFSIVVYPSLKVSIDPGFIK